MIPDQWYPIFESGKLEPGKPVGVTRLGRSLVLWRSDTHRVACFSDRCPHRAARLSRGRIRDGSIECPFHGLRFDEKGHCVRIPANGGSSPIPEGFDLIPHEIREGHGLIWYWYGEAKSEAELPWFDGAGSERGVSASASRTLPVHYLRVMEQACDQHHAPFVHRIIYPRMGTRVDDFEARAEGPLISVRGTMRRDGDGAGARQGSAFAMQVRIPSLVALELGPRMRLEASATPIDAHSTWFWVRITQTYLPAQLGGRLLARLIVWIQRIIFRLQDLPALQSQQLDDPGDIAGYHLVEADRGSALFFSLRRRLLREAGSRRASPT